MAIKLFTTLLFTLCFALVHSQTYADANVQQFTTENGLPSNGIKGLQWEEKTGFLWLATEAGIVRFNGVNFRTFTNSNTPGLTSERMVFLTRNYNQQIFASDLLGAVFTIQNNKPILWHTRTSQQNPYYGNNYLIAVSEIFYKAFEGREPEERFALPLDYVIALSDTACLIHRSKRVYYQSISSKKANIIDTKLYNISSIFKANDRTFLVSSENKIFEFIDATKSIEPFAMSTSTATLLKNQKEKGVIFWNTGAGGGIYIEANNAWYLSLKNNKIDATQIFSNIPTDALIRSVQYSQTNKTLFLGTDSKGIYIINQNRVISKKPNQVNKENRNAYYSQLVLDSNHVLTNEGIVIGKDNSNYTGSLPIKGKFTFHVSTTNDSIIWFTQYNKQLGINTLHNTNTTTGKTKVFKTKNIENVITYHNGTYYAANSRGIGKIVDDSLNFIYTYGEDMKFNATYAIEFINNHQMMLATCKGLLMYDIDNNTLTTIFNKENCCVRNLWKYKNYIFFGTYGCGFYIWKDNKIKAMPLDKNNYLLYTHGFIKDEKEYCWMSTNRGLFKASLSELIEVFEKNTSSVYYHYFGKKDGMDMTEMNGGCSPTAVTLPNKVISFPTMDGLLWVNPSIAEPVLSNGEIFIDEVIVDNQIFDYTQKETPIFSASTQLITIRLAFSAWCNQENIYIDYQLNNNPKWITLKANNENEIQLNNLSSGNYTLKIRKLNGFGFNNYTYKDIQFTITTPWYKEWWFFILCSLTIFGAIGLYLKVRTKQFRTREQKLEAQVNEKTKVLQEQNEILEKNNSIKTKLISIISHDIVTPLKFVTVAGKNLLEKRNLMSEELQIETLQEITNTSQELQLLSTNILNWIKYQNENRRLAKENFVVYDLVNQVTGILKSLAKQKKLQLVNKIDSQLKLYQYYEPLKILIYNLLTNAIHFSENGEIIISNSNNKTHQIISVTDNGSGMTREQIQNIMEDKFIISSANIDNKKGHGLGYMIIKDLLKTMNATIEISSEKNSGTTVKIMFELYTQQANTM